jgi:hypothetical protein
MTEGAATVVPASYRSFIREAFIDPIRTAVVVDDEYPTLSELLSLNGPSQDEREQKLLPVEKQKNADNVKKIIDFCRAQQPTPWLVDVHDGRTPTLEKEQVMAAHFDHTDLLILDYHLEKAAGSDKSLKILQRLAANGHFNLVAVYTQDREGLGNGVHRALVDIALGLAYPDQAIELDERAARYPARKISEWEDAKPGIFDQLLDSLDEVAFLKVLENPDRRWGSVLALAELQALARLFAEVPASLNLTVDVLFRYVLSKAQSKYRPKMAKQSFGRVMFGEGPDVANWIRTDSLFVTVISKEHDPSSIPDKLLTALEAWDPIPHRLIMSKMRSELSLKGGIAETDALRNRHLQAAWLRDILEEQRSRRQTNVRQDVARHWESLGGTIWPGVLDFSDRLTEFLAQSDREALFKRFDRYGARTEASQVYLQINSYVCSKPTEGHHLSTGHVYRTGSDATTHQYWLCLTPACDLEPGQGADSGWKKRLGSWMPLKIVRLFKASEEVALTEATRGHHLFLPIDGEVQLFGFADAKSDKPEAVPTLRWEQAFAKNFGNFDDGATIEIARLSAKDGLEVDVGKAVVVGQLRYEYALNLLNRLGAHLSRVGLDFRSQPPPG